jgi:hypothetical protein
MARPAGSLDVSGWAAQEHPQCIINRKNNIFDFRVVPRVYSVQAGSARQCSGPWWVGRCLERANSLSSNLWNGFITLSVFSSAECNSARPHLPEGASNGASLLLLNRWSCVYVHRLHLQASPKSSILPFHMNLYTSQCLMRV